MNAATGSDPGKRETAFSEVDDCQKTFRCLMETMSRPGEWRILELPPLEYRPSLLSGAAFALAKTLCDGRTTLALSRSLRDEAAPYLYRNTDARSAGVSEAAFLLVSTSDADEIDACKDGSDECPEDSAFIIVQAEPGVEEKAFVELRISGPGIQGSAAWAVPASLSPAIRRIAERNAHFPLGIDAVLIDGEGRIAGIPRSMEIVWPT